MPNGNQQQQIMQAVAAELQKGTNPQIIIKQLVQMRVPQDQAMKIVEYVYKQMKTSGAEEEAVAPQMADGGSAGSQEQQMMQIMQQVAEMLQQGMQPEEVMQQLVQMGIPQEQAQQIIQAVIQQMQGQQQGAQEEMMEGPQGQNPQEEAMEGQMPMQRWGGRMRRGGSTPCYNCGGMYAEGGSTYSGNTWFGQGGAYVPSYGEFAYGGFNEIPSLFTKQPDRAEYGRTMPYKKTTFAKGGQPGASLKIGQEMDVTPEQLDHLRSLGYQIKMI